MLNTRKKPRLDNDKFLVAPEVTQETQGASYVTLDDKKQRKLENPHKKRKRKFNMTSKKKTMTRYTTSV